MAKPRDFADRSDGRSAPALVPSDACGGCGYDLAGLASDVPCPECSLPAALARARPAILAIEPDILRRARTGLLIVGWAWFAMIVFELAIEYVRTMPWRVNLPEGIWLARSAVAAFVGIVASMGLWRAALLMRESRVTSVRWTAAMARVVALLSIPALTIGWVLSFGGLSALAGGMGPMPRFLFTLWFVGTWIVLPLVLRDASRRLEAPRLHRWSTLLLVLCILWAGCFEGAVMTLLRLGVLPQSTLISALWDVSSWLAYVAYVVAGVIALRLARRLRRAAADASVLREAG